MGKKKRPKKLPLLVLYADKESWYLEKDSQPLAIFLEGDMVGVYVKDLGKMPYAKGRNACMEMEVENLFWRLPNINELRLLSQKLKAFNETAKLLNVEPIGKGFYWSVTKESLYVRRTLCVSSKKEKSQDEYKGAHVRPFLVM